MKRTHVLLAALALTGCVAPGDGAEPSSVLHLGDHYESSAGSLFVIRVQDEYRLIHCVSSGPIVGCYEDLLSVPNDAVRYNRWMRVEKVPDLEMAIVSPLQVAFRRREETEKPR